MVTITHFDVQLSVLPNGKTWRQNIQLDILTYSATRAIELALERYPNGEVHVVQKRGSSGLIIDSNIKDAI